MIHISNFNHFVAKTVPSNKLLGKYPLVGTSRLSWSIMEDDNSVSPSAGIMTDLSNATEITQNSLLNNSITAVDYSPDDEDLDDAAAAAEATRDTLADGLVASLLRPCVDRLDASVQSTR